MKSNKNIKITLKIVEWGVSLLLLVIFLVVISPFLPTKHVFSSYFVPTGSMEPTIPAGSLVFTRPIEPNTLQKGQIIAFQSPDDLNKTILHRITSIVKKDNLVTLQTKGDNNNAIDGWELMPTAVLGEWVYTIPYVGYFAQQLKNPVGFGIFIGIPAVIMIIYNLFKIREGIRSEVEKRLQKRLATEHSVLLFCIIIASTLFIIYTPSASAQFRGNASYSGMSISAKESFSDIDTEFPDRHTCLFRIKKIGGYKKLKYRVEYDTDKGKRGEEGEIDLHGQRDIERKITLGTCSADECIYDKGVKNMKISVEFERKNGKKTKFERDIYYSFR